MFSFLVLLYPHFNEVERGVYWFHLVRLSVHPSIRPSVGLFVWGQNRAWSVSSTILAGSFSYLHILSSNFRRYVSCNLFVCLKTKKFGVLANSLNLQLWLCLILTCDPIYESIVWVIMGRWGVSSERRHSSCSGVWLIDAFHTHNLTYPYTK